MTISAKLFDALDIQCAAFEKRKIKYALIGGVALSYLGHARFTNDIDFIVQIPQISLPGLLDELNQQGFELDQSQAIRAWTQDKMLVLHFDGYRIDWLNPPLALYQHVIETAKEVIWKSKPISVATPESMVLLKLIAFRDNDKSDIQALIAGFSEKLNLSYIESEWQTIGDLSDPPMQWFKEHYQQIITRSK